MNFNAIRKNVGVILCIEAGFMLPPLVFALFGGDAAAIRGFVAAIAALLAVGLPCTLVKRGDASLNARDGCVTVAFGWIIMSLFGAIPYYASGAIHSISGAVFETVSGFSTTGATVFADVESVSRAILLWRSITNWLGGMGVLVFLLAIIPIAREGGAMFLLRAEFPGPMAGKLVPRMQKSAKLLYEIYMIMTVVQIILLSFAMPLFDAVNISLTTVSTGGFAVRNDSLMSYSVYAQVVVEVFMFLCGVSFSIFYCVIAREFLRIRKNHELRLYVIIILAAALFMCLDCRGSFDTLGESIHHTLFNSVAVISTTAFVTVDPKLWTDFAKAIIVILMLTGPMAGSTGGGIKLSRIMIMLKSTYRALARTIVPNSTHLIHQDGEIVDEDTVSTVESFAIAYGFFIAVSAVLLTLEGITFGDGVSAAISAMGNVGLGIDTQIFTSGVAHMSVLGKAVLCFDMFLGRLEIFPLLILFAPGTWRK